MGSEPNSSTSIWLYAALYLGILAAILVIFSVTLVMIVGLDQNIARIIGRFIAFVTQFISAVASHLLFVRRNLRLFSRSEFWKMVGFATCVPLVSTGLALMFGKMGATSPGAPIIALNGIIAFVATSLGYSNWIGKPVLKALLARLARADAKST